MLTALAVLLATMWIASQGGLAAIAPVSFLANIGIILDALPALGAVWLGAAGFGYPLRRVLLPTVTARSGVVTQLGLGLAALLLVNWMLACLGLLNMLTAWGMCGVGVALLLVQLVRAQRSGSMHSGTAPILLPWTLPIAMLGPGVMLVAAACPPGTLWHMEAFGYDVLTYHLQLPREWLEAGAMTGLHHNVYSYMPSLIEAAYMQLAAMQGGVYEAIYTTQLFHVSLACFAGVAVACAVARFVGPVIATLAGGAMLALPWTIITGSLAYNEMAMLAFGGVALGVMFDEAGSTQRGGAAMGALLGAATLAKLTAGLMLAVPMGVIVLMGWHRTAVWRRPTAWRVNLRNAAVMTLAGALMLAPYLVRNSMWTDNPTFPFATSVFGTAHWNDTQAARWQRGHGVSWSDANRGEALIRQWLLNTGYGAVGGWQVQRTAENIARFDREGGVPLLWLAVVASCAIALRRRETQPIAAAMGVLMALQLGAWLSVTHLQSRFLLPTLLPAAGLLALGLGELHRRLPGRFAWGSIATGGAMVGAFALSSGIALHHQAIPVTDQTGQRRRAAPALLIDSFVQPGTGRAALVGNHPINNLPRNTRTYLVADNQSLLYLNRPIAYHTPFDPSPLGAMIRQAEGDPRDVNRLLRQRGITHVWVNWSELDRLHETYGYDQSVTRGMLRKLIDSGWRAMWSRKDRTALYALPAS